MSKYSIGVDYGSESARALLLNIKTGEEVASEMMEYPHLVMSEQLPCGKKLEPFWALQHPKDYIDTLEYVVKKVVEKTEVSPEDIVGLGIDFTACTILPMKKDGTPLCYLDEYKSNPHAYVKLWKHHAAQDEANKLNEIANKMGEKFIARYGGKISSEWYLPKVWQVLDEAPEVYEATDKFIEATDWVIMQLTGRETRNSCTAGYKAIWHKKEGFPRKNFLRALDEKLENLYEEKFDCEVSSIGDKAGELTAEMAKKLGLKEGMPIAVANVDAHVAVPAMGVTEPGKMVMIMGTSTCSMVLSDKEVVVPGICGYVEDGIIPGLYGYEAGQSAVGDIFAWFVKNCVPQTYIEETDKLGLNIHQYLTIKAEKLNPGDSGLLALDWLNGNRTVLVDTDLTGVILGLNLNTKPEEIYRALIESTAYGHKKIVDTFKQNGVEINELYTCGGLPQKNRMLIQIYADVTNLPIRISKSTQTPALGSAMFGAVVAGKENGGFESIHEAARVIPKLLDEVINPIPGNVEIYSKIYAHYDRLHDYFGRGENNVMKDLKKMRKL
ncbi:ribulokinase [Clostridium nigeriense]|uniref:ribulokinase n=1 Tax=Clostridium nigeriense TaxID=1805470 RepID=UPI003D33EEB6